MYRVGVLAILAIGMTGCGETPTPEEPTSGAGEVAVTAASSNQEMSEKQAREKLRAADLAHSASSSSLPDGFMAPLTDDAVFLWPNATYVQGKAAIAEVLAAPPPPFVPGIGLSWTPVFADVSVDGKVGYSFGNAEITRPGLTTLRGQYIAFWRREQGTWKVEAWDLSPAFVPPGPLPADFGVALLESGGGPFHPVDRSRETEALLAVDAAFSQASVDFGQAVAFGVNAHEHAIILNGGDPDFIIGREAIIESRQGGEGTTLSWVPRLGGVGPKGDLGWTMGTWLFQAPGGTGNGKYLTIWQKTPSGEWKFVQDGGSGNPPPAP
jgi:ketosteroid isomerase-like protein